jgi:hypothetical protein
VPEMVRQAGVSDKFLHYIAYMIFSFVLWSTLSPFEKINWRKWQVWVVIAVSLAYGGIDEISQQHFGRGTDIKDFYSNLCGISTVLLVMSFFRFWQGLLIVSSIVMYILPNFSSGNMLLKSPLLNTIFHFGGFAFWTMVWIHNLDNWISIKVANVKWFFAALIPPALFLLIVKLTTQFIVNKPIWMIDYLAAIIGIILVILISAPTLIFRNKIIQQKQDNEIYRY